MFYNIVYRFFSQDISLFNVFKYVSFRSICAFLTSFILALVLGKKVIIWLKSIQKNGQPIREDGPESHLVSKKGTPTMGGIIILSSLVFSTMLWADLTNPNIWICLLVTAGFGLIGFVDDFTKLKHNSSKGMSSSKKFIFQSIVTLAAYALITKYDGFTMVHIPFFKNIQIDLGIFFPLWMLLVVVGSSNAVNLTDGLDGLAIGPVFLTSICLAIICYLVGNSMFSEYLHIKYIAGLSELCVFLSALVGSSLGFLWYNAPPAKIFMGDTGSLTIGGVLGFISVISKHEFVYAIIGGVFVLEAVSVILQVTSFKLTGKRIFLMAPIHHHFEKKGWAESTIVFRFWIISIVLGILGLATIKLR